MCTSSVDSDKGTYLEQLASEFTLRMEFIGITKKNAYLEKSVDCEIKNSHSNQFSSNSFDIFPGTFTETYDSEVALLDLVNIFG